MFLTRLQSDPDVPSDQTSNITTVDFQDEELSVMASVVSSLHRQVQLTWSLVQRSGLTKLNTTADLNPK